MTRVWQGIILIAALIVVSAAILASALVWGPHHCKAAFPMVLGCAVGSYESLAGGLIASSAALFAGWLAWSAVQKQIEAEERRLAKDRIEVAAMLREDVDDYAEALASIWKVLAILDALEEPEKSDLDATMQKREAVLYGIQRITEPSRIASSRNMIAVLDWRDRRRHEEMFEQLEKLRTAADDVDFDPSDTLSAVKSVSNDFEIINPKVGEYFEGLFRRAGKAWSLGYAVEVQAGLHNEAAGS